MQLFEVVKRLTSPHLECNLCDLITKVDLCLKSLNFPVSFFYRPGFCDVGYQ